MRSEGLSRYRAILLVGRVALCWLPLAAATGCNEPYDWNHDAGDAGDADGSGDVSIECPAGQSECGGRCVDLDTDQAHCGRCGSSCPADQHCDGGACVPGCLDECETDGARECHGSGWRQCGELDGVDTCLEWSADEACPAGHVCDPTTSACREHCGDFCDPFSIVLLPDTQYYTSRAGNGTYAKQAQWIIDHREEDNILFVVHLGDITNDNLIGQWAVADEAHAMLDQAGVPYSMVPGNHDYRTAAGFDRGGSHFDEYFGQDRYDGQPWYGGGLGRSNTNNYTFFEWGSLRFMVISLEYAPRKDALCWAEQLIADHPDHRVIIATHCYLTHGGAYGANCPDAKYTAIGADGATVFDELVARHSNVFMVVSGHVGDSEHRTVHGNTGNPVVEMLVDYQCEDFCTASDPARCTDSCRAGTHTGNGWLRELVFDPRAGQVHARTITVEDGNTRVFPGGVPTFFCSPLYQGSDGGNWYESNPLGLDHDYTFEYDMTPARPYARDDAGSHGFLDRTVNSVGGGDQLVPVVALSPEGRFVVAWEDDSSAADEAGNHDILARGFAAGGCEAFDDIAVNADTAGHQQTPAAAMDAAGNFVVAWADDGDDNGIFQIHARGFSASGAERFARLTVNSVDDGQQLDPAIAMAPDGGFVVAWADDRLRDGNAQIWVRGFAADGTERFADRSVHADAAGVRIRPALGMGPDGGFVVAWQDDSDGNGTYQIHARGFDADGAERFARLTVNSVADGQQRSPTVGVDDSGAFVVAWEDDQDGNGAFQVMARGFGADGAPRLADFRVPGEAGGAHLAPALSMASDGSFALCWQDDGDGNGTYQVRARSYHADGSAWLSERTVNRVADGQQLSPHLGLDGTGALVVAWQDDMDGNGSYQIVARGLDGP